MAPRASIRAPTTASLPDNLRIPSSTPALLKSLNRLSRSSLIDIALQWLDEKNIDLYPPYLTRRGGTGGQGAGDWEVNEDDDEDEINPYPAARDAEEARNVYQELRDRKGGKREVIDRILEGDWRQGLSLRQLATIDVRFIEDHPAGQQRWTALQLARVSAKKSTDHSLVSEDLSSSLPRFHASTFLKNLQREISPLVKAHYHISRLKTLPLTLLRIFVTDSPYRHPRQASQTLDSSRIIYVAFPDSCPFIYTSLSSPNPSTASSSASSSAANTRTLKMVVRDSIPKALSRPQERYSLQPTSLTAKSLQTLLSLRGPGRTNAANGIFSIFADAVVDTSPVDPRFSSLPSIDSEGKENGSKYTRQPQPSSTDTTSQKRPLADISLSSKHGNKNTPQPSHKKQKLQSAAVSSRFGTTSSQTTAPLDRLQIHLQDPPLLDGEEPPPIYDDDDENTASDIPTSRTMTLTFSGTDVISGIRQLAEYEIVDPSRMPSWMTGEEGVSTATIRGGRRRGGGE
ncbi:hypothetical protein FQN54_007278 [Arachnomyces sp. PD_36]|nr:hypothetical protein FQN54_007278 [Arachnomyces sp. PD_36]